MVLWYSVSIFTLDPAALDLAADRAAVFRPVALLLLAQVAMVVVALALTLADRGWVGQAILIGWTFLHSVIILGVYGFVVMTSANPFLRQLAVAQWLSLLSCLLVVTVIDVFLYRNAESVGELRWGQMPVRSQYVLIALAVLATENMGVMGYIRSGLRENWHVYGVLEDTSPWAFTPTEAYAMSVISVTVALFLGMMGLMFWLAELGQKGSAAVDTKVATSESA